MSETITLETGEVLDLADYPLPEGIDDAILNMSQIAKALAASLPTITRWIDQGMPVHQSGGNGKAYEFQLHHCFAWRKWREGCESKARAEKDALADQMAMHFLGGEEEAGEHPRGLSAKEMREYSEAEIKRNQAAEMREDLVRVNRVEAVFEDIIVSYRTAVLNLPDWLEQEFNLSPAQVEKAEQYCAGLLAETRRLIESTGWTGAQVVALEGQPEAG